MGMMVSKDLIKSSCRSHFDLTGFLAKSLGEDLSPSGSHQDRVLKLG